MHSQPYSQHIRPGGRPANGSPTDGQPGARARAKAGSVEAGLRNPASDFTVTTETTSGSVHVPAGSYSGDYRMHISTTSGDITVGFTE